MTRLAHPIDRDTGLRILELQVRSHAGRSYARAHLSNGLVADNRSGGWMLQPLTGRPVRAPLFLAWALERVVLREHRMAPGTASLPAATVLVA